MMMPRKLIGLLCASLCFVSASWAVPGRNEAKPRKRTGISTVAASSKADTTKQNTRTLFADRLEIKAKGTESKTERTRELNERERRAALSYPAEDLYGEDSWNNRVNPLAGTDSEIPTSYDINISDFVMPISGRRISSGFGYRSSFRRMHYGVDLPLRTNDTVAAAFDGKVRYVGYESGGYGNYIIVRHPNGLETIYGHLNRKLVHENQIVLAGQAIGLGGSTGRSTGPHLHFECRFMGRPLNPCHLFDFELGVPQRDTYAFSKGSSDRYAAPSGRSYAKKSSGRKGRTPAPKTYRIRQGDTLSAIAKRHGTTVSRLKRMNGSLNDRNLKLNTSIRIK